MFEDFEWQTLTEINSVAYLLPNASDNHLRIKWGIMPQ
jgi:hypothetical protein